MPLGGKIQNLHNLNHQFFLNPNLASECGIRGWIYTKRSFPLSPLPFFPQWLPHLFCTFGFIHLQLRLNPILHRHLILLVYDVQKKRVHCYLAIHITLSTGWNHTRAKCQLQKHEEETNGMNGEWGGLSVWEETRDYTRLCGERFKNRRLQCVVYKNKCEHYQNVRLNIIASQLSGKCMIWKISILHVHVHIHIGKVANSGPVHIGYFGPQKRGPRNGCNVTR